ncbi:hypothetical protein KP509_31G022800 [Ceratopteris richardii]|uniref:HIG1 domain-containing protein n=1 Tax=Ceratopteris richardii TaxID=49495 RepID=A0A8T2QW65_CERRI|nr:hypothetical protein KP509_31G022800 [Ceratopteris richardii]
MASGQSSESGSSTSSSSIMHWISEHRLRSVGILWASGIAVSLAYNWSRPHIPTSVKILHARVHAQALTLIGLAAASGVEYYEHSTGEKAKKYEKHF